MSDVATENAMSQMVDYGVQGIWKWFPPSSPEDAALAVVNGGAKNYREVFYPYFQAKSIALLRDWFPATLSAINTYITTYPHG